MRFTGEKSASVEYGAAPAILGVLGKSMPKATEIGRQHRNLNTSVAGAKVLSCAIWIKLATNLEEF